MPVVAALGPVLVTLPVAVDPEIVVPLQVVGPDFVDDLNDAIEDPLARFVRRETELSRPCVTVLAVLRGEPLFLRHPGRAGECACDALWLEPEAKLHLVFVREIDERPQAFLKFLRVDRPCAET